MTMEDLNCDISHILQNRDFTVLQSLVSHCHNFRAKIAAKVDDAIAYEIETKEKRALRINKISELQQEISRLKSEIDATKLQQKIVDKKISNASKQHAVLKEDIDNAKSKRDDLSLEMIDLKQECEKRKESKVLLWDAIKRACHVYKQYLDFHICLLEPKEHERVHIAFFIHNADLNNKYFVRLINSNNQWKVEEIQPMLKKEHFIDFKGIIDSSAELEIVDITAFICKLRYVFVKYYLNEK